VRQRTTPLSANLLDHHPGNSRKMPAAGTSSRCRSLISRSIFTCSNLSGLGAERTVWSLVREDRNTDATSETSRFAPVREQQRQAARSKVRKTVSTPSRQRSRLAGIARSPPTTSPAGKPSRARVAGQSAHVHILAANENNLTATLPVDR